MLKLWPNTWYSRRKKEFLQLSCCIFFVFEPVRAVKVPSPTDQIVRYLDCRQRATVYTAYAHFYRVTVVPDEPTEDTIEDACFIATRTKTIR
jgi:hypothetical protein